MRALRTRPYPEPLLRQPPLPPVSKPQDQAVAGAADGTHAPRSSLHDHFHGARGVARLHQVPSEDLLRRAVRRIIGGPEEALPGSPARGGRPAGLLRRAAYLGQTVAVSS